MYRTSKIVPGSEADLLCRAAQDLYDNPPKTYPDNKVDTDSLFAWLERANAVNDRFTTFVLLSQRPSNDHGALHEHTSFVETLPLMSAGGIKEMYEDCRRIQLLGHDATDSNRLGLYEPDGSLGSVYTTIDEYYRWNFQQVRAVFLKYVISTRNNIPDWMAK